MWIFTKDAFINLKAHSEKPDHLLVRARIKGDIERYWPCADVEESNSTDYRFRATISRAEVESVLAKAIADIDYTSFKRHLDPSRFKAHLAMADIMIQMQEEMMEEET